MIPVIRFYELLTSLQADVNLELEEEGLSIDHIALAATELQVSKKIGEKSGVVLVAKIPPSTSDIRTPDDYSEDNQCLFFILEKQEPAKVTDEKERLHYAKVQRIMRSVKTWIMNHGLHSGQDDETETLSKPLRTEWEYQVYGNFNGLSLGFDLKDFEL